MPRSKKSPSNRISASELGVERLEGVRKKPLESFASPELATLVEAAPGGDEWLHELKYDGYRVLARLEEGKVKLLTRRGKDWSARMPALVRHLSALRAQCAMLDGEVCVLDASGKSDFQRLQNSLSESRDDACIYFAFDLLHFDGYDLRAAPLAARKEVLKGLLQDLQQDSIRYSDHVVGSGSRFHQKACKAGLEGIISKRCTSRYTGKRTKDWLKVKCSQRQELVIGGFTEPSGSRSGFGALLVGTYEGAELKYRGKVGTGYTQDTLDELHALLRSRERKSSPFADTLRGRESRGVHWVKPDLLAEVEYTELTSDGRLRHPRFKGLRRDKSADTVGLERPAP